MRDSCPTGMLGTCLAELVWTSPAPSKQGGTAIGTGDQQYVKSSLDASHQVQLEDIALCEAVQRGLGSPAYDTGR